MTVEFERTGNIRALSPTMSSINWPYRSQNMVAAFFTLSSWDALEVADVSVVGMHERRFRDTSKLIVGESFEKFPLLTGIKVNPVSAAFLHKNMCPKRVYRVLTFTTCSPAYRLSF